MNLRKDHSHAISTFESPCTEPCEALARDGGVLSYSDAPGGKLVGGREGGTVFRSSSCRRALSLEPLFVFLLYLLSGVALPTMSIRLTTFSDGCLGSNNDEGRSEV